MILVVEMLLPEHWDGMMFPGTNAAGETGPTYIRADDCGAPTFVTMADLGVPDVHFVQTLLGSVALVGDANGDGVVNVLDLLLVLGNF